MPFKIKKAIPKVRIEIVRRRGNSVLKNYLKFDVRQKVCFPFEVVSIALPSLHKWIKDNQYIDNLKD